MNPTLSVPAPTTPAVASKREASLSPPVVGALTLFLKPSLLIRAGASGLCVSVKATEPKPAERPQPRQYVS